MIVCMEPAENYTVKVTDSFGVKMQRPTKVETKKQTDFESNSMHNLWEQYKKYKWALKICA